MCGALEGQSEHALRLQQRFRALGLASSSLDAALEAVQEQLQLAARGVRAAQKGLQAVRDSLPDVTDTLARAVAARQEWEALARKHSLAAPADLLPLRQRWAADQAALATLSTALPELAREESSLRREYAGLAGELTGLRAVAAAALLARVNALLPSLELRDKRVGVRVAVDGRGARGAFAADTVGVGVGAGGDATAQWLQAVVAAAGAGTGDGAPAATTTAAAAAAAASELARGLAPGQRGVGPRGWDDVHLTVHTAAPAPAPAVAPAEVAAAAGVEVEVEVEVRVVLDSGALAATHRGLRAAADGVGVGVGVGVGGGDDMAAPANTALKIFSSGEVCVCGVGDTWARPDRPSNPSHPPLPRSPAPPLPSLWPHPHTNNPILTVWSFEDEARRVQEGSACNGS